MDIKQVFQFISPVAKVPGEWNFINPRKKGFKKINVKSAEPIGPKFFVGHHVTPGKVYEWSKFQIFVSIKIRSSLNFWKFWKSTKFFVKIRELILFCFTMYTKRTCSQLIWKMGAKHLIRLIYINMYITLY